MRILHVSTRLILGGSQENTILSCEGQAARGHEVHLAFGPIYGPEGSLLERVQRFRTRDGQSITTHEIPDMIREISPVRDTRGYKQLRDLIERLQPDIVHTHSSKAGILGRSAAWAVQMDPDNPRPVGVVHTIHGPPFMPVEGSLARRAKVRVSNQIYTLAERHAARRCHVIVSVADAMTQQFLARGISKPDQYVTVRSGMEIDSFLHADHGETRAEIRTSLDIPPDALVFGTVARLAEHKGHDDLLDALADDLRSNPHWRLLWVGDGWWRERLMARVRELNLEKQVVVTGLVPPERVPGLMRAMDVLIHPSYREGLPRTVPQALLCGVPVIAYDADGTREACLDPAIVGAHRATGLLVPVGDRTRLREAAKWMAEHPTERTEMANRGQAFCESAFSTERMVDELEGVYVRALYRATSLT